LRFGTFIAADDFEIDFLAFIQGFEAASDNRGVVNEHILTRVLSNETESFFVIEPFDFATGHMFSPEMLELADAAKLKGHKAEQAACVPKV
jgi:hypothetical protein